MNTLTAIVWIIGIIQAFVISFIAIAWVERPRDSKSDDGPIIMMVLFASIIGISLILGNTLMVDLYGAPFYNLLDPISWVQTPELQKPFLLISGLVLLGLVNLPILIYQGRQAVTTNFQFPNIGNIAWITITLVSFIASVLGIISFYFDYLE